LLTAVPRSPCGSLLLSGGLVRTSSGAGMRSLASALAGAVGSAAFGTLAASTDAPLVASLSRRVGVAVSSDGQSSMATAARHSASSGIDQAAFEEVVALLGMVIRLP
jgi:hypothetical protein